MWWQMNAPVLHGLIGLYRHWVEAINYYSIRWRTNNLLTSASLTEAGATYATFRAHIPTAHTPHLIPLYLCPGIVALSVNRIISRMTPRTCVLSKSTKYHLLYSQTAGIQPIAIGLPFGFYIGCFWISHIAKGVQWTRSHLANKCRQNKLCKSRAPRSLV